MSPQTISQKLHDDLAVLISTATPGQRLPSEPVLAKNLGVSRATLREAMRTYEAQGLLRRRQGSGTYVTHPSNIIDSGLEVLESIETLSQRIGFSVKMGSKRVEERLASEEESIALGIESNSQIVHVSRVIETEGRPVAYLIDILPCDVITLGELESTFSGSVLDLLLQRGKPSLLVSRTEITAVTASVEVAKALGLQRSDVLLRFKAYLYDSDGRIVDHSYSYFLPGYFNFHVVRRVGSANTH
jgi:GntR family transcriptional regulator